MVWHYYIIDIFRFVQHRLTLSTAIGCRDPLFRLQCLFSCLKVCWMRASRDLSTFSCRSSVCAVRSFSMSLRNLASQTWRRDFSTSERKLFVYPPQPRFLDANRKNVDEHSGTNLTCKTRQSRARIRTSLSFNTDLVSNSRRTLLKQRDK